MTNDDDDETRDDYDEMTKKIMLKNKLSLSRHLRSEKGGE